MSEAPFGIESLNAGHDRLSFRSGSDPLDRYLGFGVQRNGRSS